MSIELGLSGAQGHYSRESAGKTYSVKSMHHYYTARGLVGGLVPRPATGCEDGDWTRRFLGREPQRAGRMRLQVPQYFLEAHLTPRPRASHGRRRDARSHNDVRGMLCKAIKTRYCPAKPMCILHVHPWAFVVSLFPLALLAGKHRRADSITLPKPPLQQQDILVLVIAFQSYPSEVFLVTRPKHRNSSSPSCMMLPLPACVSVNNLCTFSPDYPVARCEADRPHASPTPLPTSSANVPRRTPPLPQIPTSPKSPPTPQSMFGKHPEPHTTPDTIYQPDPLPLLTSSSTGSSM